MAFTFKSFLPNLLPKYFWENDTNKDLNGKGTLIRYMENYGAELDEEFYPFIQNFMNLFDALKCDEKFLNHLAFIVGNPISVSNDFSTYRKIIAYAVAIYKVKGTKLSYQLLFNLLGIDIDIVEELPRRATRYDDIFSYDHNIGTSDYVRYDDDCEKCSFYTIVYWDPLNPLLVVDPTIIAKFQNIICFLQPINAKLRGFVRSLFIEDDFTLSVGEDVIGFNQAPNGAFSDGFDTEFSFN